MADRINLNRFRNINFAPNKNVVKTTAAVTLLLSTVACDIGNEIVKCAAGLCSLAFLPALLWVVWKINGGGYQGGGGGSDWPHPTQ